MTGMDRTTDNSEAESKPDARDWSTDDAFWQANYSSRAYAAADRPYEHYQPAYRYGHEAATTAATERDWNDMEGELRSGWNSYEHRYSSNKSTWEEIKDAAKDAWDRVRGHGDPNRHDRP